MNKTNNLKTSAFTLSEVMIVLTIIGVLTAILLPVARNSTPNENIMKFKKAHNTFYSAIRELVNSDKYYLNGDLGIKANGELLNSTKDEHKTYLCETLADVISVKFKNCQPTDSPYDGIAISNREMEWHYELENAMQKLDDVCLDIQSTNSDMGFKDENNVSYFEVNPTLAFGISAIYHQSIDDRTNDASTCESPDWCKKRWFNGDTVELLDENGFVGVYKIFCLDIDDPNQGEAPFGYGIRFDGKILAGAKASKWLAKSIQEKD